MSAAAYQPLSAADNTFLELEDGGAHMHIAATLVFGAGSLATASGGVDITAIRAYVASRLHLIPRYRQRLAWVPVSRLPVWVDDEHFNLEYHVRHTSLPRPGSREQLAALAARIQSQRLDRAKPLWEFWVVEGLQEEGGPSFAIIQKTHHCMIDGMSGADLMAVLLSPFPGTEVPAAPPFVPRAAPGGAGLFLSEAWRSLREPATAIASLSSRVGDPSGLLRDVVEGVEGIAETLAATARPASPTPWNQPIGPHRRFAWWRQDLAEVKAVRKALGGTVNDVVLATVAGALRRFLLARGLDPDEMRIRANVPVSLRGAEERSSLGNRIALWMTDLPVDEEDVLHRFGRVKDTTHGLKESRQALGAQVLASVSDMTTWRLLALATRLSMRARPFNLVVTNVPGPQLELFLLDAPLKEIYPMVNLLQGQGIGVALFSYAGALHWGVLSDWDLVPDLERFLAALREAFEELHAAAAAAAQGSLGQAPSGASL